VSSMTCSDMIEARESHYTLEYVLFQEREKT
jgi:hypothetical protein